MYLESDADESVALPDGAESVLVPENPRLSSLRESYARVNLPVTTHSRWAEDVVDWLVDLRRFRGDTLFVWHFRELPRLTALKYFIYAEYVRAHDPASLLERLGEDGAFGCWSFDVNGRVRYSRDLLDSVTQIYFLDRHLGVLERPSLRVLDIGAGYGRLAHRMAQAVPNLVDYCCVDAVPEGPSCPSTTSTIAASYRRPAWCRSIDWTRSSRPGHSTLPSTFTASPSAPTQRSRGGSSCSRDYGCRK